MVKSCGRVKEMEAKQSWSKEILWALIIKQDCDGLDQSKGNTPQYAIIKHLKCFRTML